MGYDEVTADLESGWLWTERHFEDTGHVIATDATSAWHWTGQQAARVGPAMAQAGVGMLGWADQKVMSYVPGHYYDTLIPMGTFDNVSPAALLDAIRHNPKSFPIPGDRNFEIGAVVTLSFFGTRNPVIVEKVDTSNPNRATMLLRTQSGYFFSGTAEHIIVRQPNHRLVYEVIGHGPERELWDRNRMNLEFGKEEWPRLVRERVVPLAKKLQAGL